MKKLLPLFLFPVCMLAQIKEMDVPFTEYVYESNSCNGYKHFTGSFIFIPADAFVTEDGSACKGKVTLRYREIKNRVDMLASGVNMILMRNNKRKMLESAGMFEIKADCNGKAMKLAPGKTIQVRMNCLKELKNLQAFIYDYDQKCWLDVNTEVYDFSFKKGDNNKDNVKLWGSGSVNTNTVPVFDPETSGVNWDSLRQVEITNMVGKLPEGYMKGMNIKTLGFYNYDAVIKDEAAIPVLAKFKLNTGEDVTEKVYVAYQKKNMLIYYTPEDMKERFVLLPEKGIRIFTLFADGTTAVMKEGELDKMNLANLKGKEFTFTLIKQAEKPKDKLALAESLKIK